MEEKQKGRAGKYRTGIIGSSLQGWKMQEDEKCSK